MRRNKQQLAPWLYDGKLFEATDLDPKQTYGFVYLITDTETGRWYVGKKFFWSSRRVKNKDTGKVKKTLVESDWRKYCGSNKNLQEEVKACDHAEKRFIREILHLCRNKSECAYLELQEQVERKALLSSKSYNDWIQVKIRKANISYLQIPDNSV